MKILTSALFALTLIASSAAYSQNEVLITPFNFNDRVGEITVNDCLVMKGGRCDLRPLGFGGSFNDLTGAPSGLSGPIYQGAFDRPTAFPAAPYKDHSVTASLELVALPLDKVRMYRDSGIVSDLIVTFTGGVSTGNNVTAPAQSPFDLANWGKPVHQDGHIQVRVWCRSDKNFASFETDKQELHVANHWFPVQKGIRLFKFDFGQCDSDLKIMFQLGAPKVQFLDARMEIHPT